VAAAGRDDQIDRLEIAARRASGSTTLLTAIALWPAFSTAAWSIAHERRIVCDDDRFRADRSTGHQVSGASWGVAESADRAGCRYTAIILPCGFG
jgi:hypothetical protein